MKVFYLTAKRMIKKRKRAVRSMFYSKLYLISKLYIKRYGVNRLKIYFKKRKKRKKIFKRLNLFAFIKFKFEFFKNLIIKNKGVKIVFNYLTFHNNSILLNYFVNIIKILKYYYKNNTKRLLKFFIYFKNDKNNKIKPYIEKIKKIKDKKYIYTNRFITKTLFYLI
jgi:hypothetical protein